SYNSYFRALRPARQLLQPVRLYDLDIVVEEQQQAAGGVLRAEIVGPRIVERRREIEDTNARIAAQRLVIGQGRRLAAAAIHQNDLIIGIDRPLSNGSHALLDKLPLVFRRDDDGDFPTLCRPGDPQKSGNGETGFRLWNADTLQMLLDGLRLPFVGSRLAHAAGPGAGNLPPVVQHFR